MFGVAAAELLGAGAGLAPGVFAAGVLAAGVFAAGAFAAGGLAAGGLDVGCDSGVPLDGVGLDESPAGWSGFCAEGAGFLAPGVNHGS